MNETELVPLHLSGFEPVHSYQQPIYVFVFPLKKEVNYAPYLNLEVNF